MQITPKFKNVGPEAKTFGVAEGELLNVASGECVLCGGSMCE